VCLLLLLGATLYALFRLSARDGGTDRIAGLDAPVEVGFDNLGIPHIRAKTRADAFAALGYVTADREASIPKKRCLKDEMHKRLDKWRFRTRIIAMTQMRRGRVSLWVVRVLRGVAAAVCLLLLLGATLYALFRLSARNGGTDRIAGLDAPVEVGFDNLGIPHIRAKTRADAFAALGYVTARDRLFQMDILRRNAAGRLAEIFGEGVVESDTRNRALGFDPLASEIFQRLPETQKAALTAYAAGVNRAMQKSLLWPFEFYALRYRPAPWRPQDSILVFLGVEDMLSNSEYQERTATVMQRALPPEVLEFLTPEADCYNEMLAPKDPARCAKGAAPVEALAKLIAERDPEEKVGGLVGGAPKFRGSNAWVISGIKTRDGRTILSNDLHLGLTVPNLFYRAELDYGSARMAGITLPGLPMILTGSNGAVAWGITNLRADNADLVRIEQDPAHPEHYLSPQGSLAFSFRTETIAVRGAPSRTLRVKETIWGPVLPQPLLGNEVAIHSSTLDPATTNFDLLEMDSIHTVESALSLFQHAGGPPLNVLLADKEGGIAWTVMGRLPKRFGLTGLFSESWADGSKGWSGFLSPQELPSVVNPSSGFLVNTNQRMPGSKEYATTLGHEYQGGFRAWRATQVLQGLSKVSEKDMLALQLDTATSYYASYQRIALDALEASGGVKAEDRELKDYLDAWNGRADPNSLGLPLIAEFSEELQDAVLSPVLARCRTIEPNFELGWTILDGPVQRIIETNRPELLPDHKKYSTWSAFLLDVLRQSAAQLRQRYHADKLQQLTWGAISKVEISHLFSGGVPILSAVLDMPRRPLPGCVYCMRYAYQSEGANYRMVVSPGHEDEGLLQLAGGQSGQPASPHYADQQANWVTGAPGPFLSQAQCARLLLQTSK
jgi:penicillin amidase